MKRSTPALVAVIIISAVGACSAAPPVTEANVRATMQALAGPEMRGRGSATDDEKRAADYLAGRLKALGMQPAGDAGGYLQRVEIHNQTFAAPPTLSIGKWQGTHGQGFAVAYADAAERSGPLQRWKDGATLQKGAVVLLPKGSRAAVKMIADGAAAAIYDHDPRFDEYFPRMAAALPEVNAKPGTIVMLDPATTAALAGVPDGTPVRIAGTLAPVVTTVTHNVLGLIPGRDRVRGDDVIMLSAHFDHLGVDAKLTGDQVFDGADDDASGVTAVLELTRGLVAGSAPKRTVLVALFGSEELGLVGSNYFLDHPPVPLVKIVANLEFEMIGRPDAAVAADQLWLTGYPLSDLGPTLAAKGAKLVDDPHPEQQFFQRSDNFALVQRGVIAHTVSSFGLHADYHKVSDDLAHIDFAHMTRSIESLQAPLRWLVDSDFVPKWNEGMKP